MQTHQPRAHTPSASFGASHTLHPSAQTQVPDNCALEPAAATLTCTRLHTQHMAAHTSTCCPRQYMLYTQNMAAHTSTCCTWLHMAVHTVQSCM